LKRNKFIQSLTVLLVAVSLIGLAACSGKKETTAATTTAPEETATSVTEPIATSAAETAVTSVGDTTQASIGVTTNVSAGVTTKTAAAEKTTAAKTDQTAVFGKVTAIKGKKITVAIGTMKQPSGRPDNMPTGSNSTQGTRPSGNQQGFPPSGGMPELLTLTGKSKTITITDSVKITKLDILSLFGRFSNQQTTATTAANDNSATLSDIAVGSILKITTKTGSDTVASIEIISFNFPGGFNPGGQNGVSTTAANGN